MWGHKEDNGENNDDNDEEKKKNCIVDVIKNYGRIVYRTQGHDKDEIDYIINNILLLDRYRESLKELCKKYVIYSPSPKVKILNKYMKMIKISSVHIF